jgi:HK97 family phage major capsid protein
MSLSNKQLAERADMVIADLNSNGGLLLPAQANRFIDMVVEQPTILRQARVIRMNTPQQRIERLGFTSRIMKAAPQGTTPYDDPSDGTNNRYLAAADRSKAVTTMITLTTKEVMAEIRLPYEVLEDNIERGALEAHVLRQAAERVAEDFEEWALEADTNSGDDYLALNDGLLITATSNVVNNASAGISPDLFEDGMLAMPQKYLRNLGNLRHFITVQNSIKYRANVAKRATGYGDSMLTSDGQLFAFGVKAEPSPLMPTATGLFTFPQNILFGIQRSITLETDKDIRSREIVMVLTARIDCKWDDESAVVKYTNI